MSHFNEHTLEMAIMELFEQQTHNLEVTGSSPVWSTLKIKQLTSS